LLDTLAGRGREAMARAPTRRLDLKLKPMQARRSDHARRRRRSLAGAIICIGLGVGVGGCGGSTAPTSTRASSSKSAPVSIFWSDTQLNANPGKTMRILKGLGVQVLRTSILWANVVSNYTYPAKRPAQLKPTDPASYLPQGWAPYDKIDRAAAATGMKLFLTITGPIPVWAAGPGRGTQFPVTWEPSPADFGDFVRAVGKRYSGRYTPPGASSPLPRIQFWSIWNEPNYGSDLKPQVDANGQPVSPRLYRGLVAAAWKGLLATGHTPATDTILIGETAPFGVEPAHIGVNHKATPEMVPLAFIRALYCVDANFQPLRASAATKIGCPASSSNFKANNPGLFDASGWAAHPYTGGKAPTVLTTGIPGSADYTDFASLPRLESTLDRAARAYGSNSKLPIYSTEFGFLTNPPNPGPTTTSPQNAAKYMNEAEFLSWRNPRIRSYNQYELIDPSASKVGNFDTGLKFFGGSHDPFAGKPKPSFYAYRMPVWMPRTSGTRRSRLQVWGCARAAPLAAQTTRQRQNVQIQFAASRGHYRTVLTVTLDPAKHGCYFNSFVHFPGSGTVRLAWKGTGGIQYSRTQPISIR
jgi:hypothetical protein